MAITNGSTSNIPATGFSTKTPASFNSLNTSTTAPIFTVVTSGTIITNNRKKGYEKTTAANADVKIPLASGLNTITFKAPDSLPVVVQIHSSVDTTA